MRKWKIWFWILAVFLPVPLCSCSGGQGSKTALSTGPGESPVVSLSTRPSQTAFKGMELYAWQNEDGDWLFSVMLGTNRYKFVEEVQANALDIGGVGQRFCEMAVGETVFWTSGAVDASGDYVSFPFPPADLVGRLREQATQCEVVLIVLER